MTNGELQHLRPQRRSAFAALAKPPGDIALWWHLGWFAAVALAAAFLAGAGLVRMDQRLAALAAGLAPALGGAIAQPRSDRARKAVIGAWGVGAALASALTGGPTGPLGVWCLAPMAAALVLGRPRLPPLAGAVSLGAAGVSALAALFLDVRDPTLDVAEWLRALALVTTGAGFGVGLVALQRQVAVRARRVGRMMANQPHLFISMRTDGRVRAAYGLTPAGVAAATLVGRPLAEAAVAEHRQPVEAAIARALAEGASESRFAPAALPQGWLALALRRVDGVHLVGALRDARAERAREVELERAREAAEAQNAGKSRFLANMSHELRTPLNAIMGFSDVMRSRLFGPLPDKYAEYAELIHESGSHLLELINDVLDMSKIEADRYELVREVFDVRESIQAVLRLMRGQADRAGVHLRGVLPREPLEIAADRRAVKQIVLNLISNALKFTPAGGSVIVGVQATEEGVELTVADTGVGIAPADLERIGRPYEQAGGAEQRAAGTGLGLSLVRAFAELHGGVMVVESRLGEGTAITVRLPGRTPAEREPA